MSADKQIAALAEFILTLDCGYPRTDDEHPNGMGAVESAIMYIHELRDRIRFFEGEQHEFYRLRVDMGRLEMYTNRLEKDYKELERERRQVGKLRKDRPA